MRRQNKQVKIVPIIVRPCLWEGTDFEKLNAANKKQNAISLSENLDEALLQITEEIKKLL